MTETDPFARIRLPDSGEILEEHRFPLFEYTGLYQKLRVPAAGVQVESIVVSLEEAADSDTQYLLNLVVASGYVAEDADLTFRENRAGGPHSPAPLPSCAEPNHPHDAQSPDYA